jgi:hypothetical protein
VMQILCTSVSKIAKYFVLNHMGLREHSFWIVCLSYELFDRVEIIIVSRTRLLALFFVVRLGQDTTFSLINREYNPLRCTLLTFYLLIVIVEV